MGRGGVSCCCCNFCHWGCLGTQNCNGKERGRLTGLIDSRLTFRDSGSIERISSTVGVISVGLSLVSTGGGCTLEAEETKKEVGFL